MRRRQSLSSAVQQSPRQRCRSLPAGTRACELSPLRSARCGVVQAPSGRKSIGSQGLRSRLANKRCVRGCVEVSPPRHGCLSDGTEICAPAEKAGAARSCPLRRNRREEEDAGDDGLLEGLSDSEGAGAGAAAARLLDSDSEDEPAAAAPSSAGGKAGSPGSSGGGAQGRAASESPAPRAEAAEKPAAAGGGGRRTLLDDDSDDEAAALEVSPAADAAAKPKKNVLDSDSDADE